MTAETVDRGLTAEQVGLLLQPLNPNRVRQQQGQSHLEAWDVRRWLTRIFGFGGWSEQILTCECIHSVTSPVGNDPQPLKHRCTAVYRVTLRLIIRDERGNQIMQFDNGAVGDSVNQPSVGDAHDMALKTALSQALKRCAIDLGDQFGLSLYNKGNAGAVVLRTYGHSGLAAQAAGDATPDAPVAGGELDEQREQAAPAPPVREAQPAQSRVQRGPQDDSPWEQPAPEHNGPSMIAEGQKKAIFKLIKQKHGPMTDAERYERLSKFARRKVKSLNEYAYAEASALINYLSGLPDFALREEDVAAEAEKLAGLPQRPQEELEDKLRDLIESAGSPAAVQAAGTQVDGHFAEGLLTQVAFDKLARAAQVRLDQLAADALYAQQPVGSAA